MLPWRRLQSQKRGACLAPFSTCSVYPYEQRITCYRDVVPAGTRVNVGSDLSRNLELT